MRPLIVKLRTFSGMIWSQIATRGSIRHLKMAQTCQKLLTLVIFRHIFAICECLICPLVAKSSFDLSGLTSKSVRDWLQKWAKSDRTTHKHVKHDNFENLTKSLKSLLFRSWDSFLSNLTTFQNNNSNLLTLQSINPKSQKNFTVSWFERKP